MYLDGTHNPAGAKELLKFWQENFAGHRIFLVYGAMRDKAVDEIAGLLFPSADFVILTEPLQPRAISAPLLAEMTAHLAKDSAVVRDPAEALERAIEMASPGDAVFATGSLYLVGDLRGYWHRRTMSLASPSASCTLQTVPCKSLRANPAPGIIECLRKLRRAAIKTSFSLPKWPNWLLAPTSSLLLHFRLC